MEYLRRKCVCCHKLYYLSCVNGNYKTCILCLEKAKETYRDDPETVIRRCKQHRDNNVEKEKERHRLYYCNNKEIIDEKKKVYNHLEYYCPVCLYNVKFYRKNKHCKSLLHLNNIKYCDEQKQICVLNSHLENNKLHNKIDAEVKLLIDEDIKNNLIQQSLLDAIRNFNIKIENAMQTNTK
jgi:hypothetical protein